MLFSDKSHPIFDMTLWEMFNYLGGNLAVPAKERGFISLFAHPGSVKEGLGFVLSTPESIGSLMWEVRTFSFQWSSGILNESCTWSELPVREIRSEDSSPDLTDHFVNLNDCRVRDFISVIPLIVRTQMEKKMHPTSIEDTQ